MKKLFLAIVVCGLLCVGCSKTNPPEILYAGKLIVNGPCGNYAVELLKGQIDTSQIVASWHDPENDSTYSNAFAVINNCTFGSNGLRSGDVFTFHIDTRPPAQTCAICMILVPVPSKRLAVKDVQKTK